ncbi:hypothetical protein EDF81_3836 [Enterobacter sp. BIGb0383]|uniref:hypothetical protein n=1 Tax=unclassified Enterobacter TaxID=2608935 RepID=UPI000F4A66F3|nr:MULTISPECIES: hypothetical protein [unclassified Enterobacter]ROP56284.1 hypothetical protein EDF81_3836 [Enterobacter sp. BIGb0383]ROS06023.1 hypothetical protein EC848_3976 [Enterobacter sp. BIGb0359]
MTTTHISSLFTQPVSHTTDFTALAESCEQFADALIVCDDPVQKMALCGRLSACLALLQPTLNDPIPEPLKESLTVADIPAHFPVFEPEAVQLADYCQVLAHLLINGGLAAETERTLTSLLYDLTGYFAGTLKAPRWLRTENDVISLETFH